MLLPMTDRAAWPTYLLTLPFGIGLLYWVWRRGGDRTLARVAPAFTRGPASGKKYTPGQVRVALTGLIVVAGGGYLVIHVVLPMPTEMPGCPGRPPNPPLNPTGLRPAG